MKYKRPIAFLALVISLLVFLFQSAVSVAPEAETFRDIVCLAALGTALWSLIALFRQGTRLPVMICAAALAALVLSWSVLQATWLGRLEMRKFEFMLTPQETIDDRLIQAAENECSRAKNSDERADILFWLTLNNPSVDAHYGEEIEEAIADENCRDNYILRARAFLATPRQISDDRRALLESAKSDKSFADPIAWWNACHSNAVSGQSGVVFSGAPGSAKSPDEKYTIVCQGRTGLAFKWLENGGLRPFYHYDRNVDILWSPDSNHFALNDNAGSNVATAFLFDVGDLSKRLDLADELWHQMKPGKDLESMTGNDHTYYNVRKWLSPTSLELIVTGHGNGKGTNGFALIYEYDLKGTFRRTKRFDTERTDLLF